MEEPVSYKNEIILNGFRELIYGKFRKDIDAVMKIKADASERKIYRLRVGNNTYAGIYNENVGENTAFINFTNTFIELGLRVPVVLSSSEDKLFYIEQDLGDNTLFSLQCERSELLNYHKAALSDLMRFQIEAKDVIDYNYCHQTRQFDADVVNSDLEKFSNFFVKNFCSSNFNTDLLIKIRETSARVLSNVNCDYFLYRDFQPRNIMLHDGTLYYIDYQAGRKGPLQYDVASFLYSGSISLDVNEREMLLNHYISGLESYISFDKDEFNHYFYYFVFLRLLQVLGSYAYLNEKRNDKQILKKIPKALNNMKSLIGKIEDKDVVEMIKTLAMK